MPRQTFFSKEFFVNISESTTRLIVLSLPKDIDNIKFVNQHSLTQTISFLYQNVIDKKIYRVVVSLLPLNDDYTRVHLQISYTNNQAFYHDNGMKQALIHFECAIQAAVNGEAFLFVPFQQEVKSSKKLFRFIQTIFFQRGLFSLKNN